jgi:hypothetical protein
MTENRYYIRSALRLTPLNIIAYTIYLLPCPSAPIIPLCPMPHALSFSPSFFPPSAFRFPTSQTSAPRFELCSCDSLAFKPPGFLAFQHYPFCPLPHAHCSIRFAPCHSHQLATTITLHATHTPQPEPRNPQLVPRNPNPVTRTP